MGLPDGTAMIITCLAVIVLEAFAGVIASVYVVIIILFDFYRRKNIRTGNKIRVALSISNMLFSIVSSSGVFSGFFWPQISRATSTTYILYSLLMYTISCCSWLSASLSFFYFVKIVRLRSNAFLWVKSKIGSIVPWTILVSEVVSLGSFLITLLSTAPHISQDSSNSTTTILSLNMISENTMKSKLVHMIIIVTSLPLLTVIVTSISTIVVLKQHKHNMEKNMGPSGNVQLTTYQNAWCRMLRLMLFFIAFYVFLLFFYMADLSEQSLVFWICCIILTSFSAVQSILLVLGNQKLKGAWKELFQCITESKQVNTPE